MSNSLAFEDAETMKLVALLEHPKGDMRFSALMRMQLLKPEKLASYATEVSKCLTDEDASVSWLAVKILERLKPMDFEQHVTALASLAKTPNAHVRQTAVEVMTRSASTASEVVVTRSASTASEVVVAKQEAARMSKQEASQVRVWLARREEEKRAKDKRAKMPAGFAKMLVGLARNEEERRKIRNSWKAEEKADEAHFRAQAAAVAPAPVPVPAPAPALAPAPAPAAPTLVPGPVLLGRELEGWKDVRASLEETTEARKTVPSKEKKQKLKSPSGMPSARERVAEKEKQTKTGDRLTLLSAS